MKVTINSELYYRHIQFQIKLNQEMMKENFRFMNELPIRLYSVPVCHLLLMLKNVRGFPY